MKARSWLTICLLAFVFSLLTLRHIRSRLNRVATFPPTVDAKASDLKLTHTSPYLEVPISPGTNVLWCGTFQLAWNEAVQLFGEPVRFREPVAFAEFLNHPKLTRTNIDEASFVATSGELNQATIDRIRTEAGHKFGRSFSKTLLNGVEKTPTRDGLLFYACLLKNLAFENEFQNVDEPLLFNGESVRAFGITKMGGDAFRLIMQVSVLDFQTTNNFVLELRSKDRSDRVILAKVPPEQTLAGTLSNVLSRCAHPNKFTPSIEQLVIPQIDFNVRRSYEELVGRHLALTNAVQFNGWPTVSADQLIRFRLNQKGAFLESESEVAVACPSAEPARYIFDRPFLVLLTRTDSQSPYFALWVDNAELLVPLNR